jgi:hypothetical protein
MASGASAIPQTFFKVADGIVAKAATVTILIQTTEGVPDVVWKEAFVVEHCGEHLGNAANVHFLVVFERVVLQTEFDILDQSDSVSLHATSSQHSITRSELFISHSSKTFGEVRELIE